MRRNVALAKNSTARASAVRRPDDTLVVELSGDWRMSQGLPSPEAVQREITSGSKPRRVSVDGGKIGSWDSGLLIFVNSLAAACQAGQIELDLEQLPMGVARLIRLAEQVPERKGARSAVEEASFMETVGLVALSAKASAVQFTALVGALTLALGRMISGKARYRGSDLFRTVRECGADAFGIVSLISFLVGVILAFMGAVQLRQFGASIYVADLVAIGMVREMGAMMTGIILSGRTGAAFAAQLGTMKVTEEIDALTTMGISPIEFLVAPRFIALVAMMPFLCVYSDLMGIAGGLAVGLSILGMPLKLYYQQTVASLTLTQFFGGLVKATTYGGLIALAGCGSGLQCGSSASAVGEATTRAVVNGIVLIVAACGFFSVIFNALGI